MSAGSLICVGDILASADEIVRYMTTDNLARGRGFHSHYFDSAEGWQPCFEQDVPKYGFLHSLLALPLRLTAGAGGDFSSVSPQEIVWQYEMPTVRAHLSRVMWFNPLVFTCCCILFYLTALRLGYSVRSGVGGTLALGFCTILFAYVPTFFTEPLSALLLLGAFFFALGQSKRDVFLSAFCVGWLVANNAVYALVLPVLLFWRLWGMERNNVLPRFVKSDLPLFAIGVLPGGLLLAYQIWLRHGFGYQDEPGFTTPLLIGLFGFLLSPGKSVFVFSPILIVCLFGFKRFWRTNQRAAALALGFSVPILLAYSKWYNWAGGTCWGPRFLLPLVPLAMLGLLPVLEAWRGLSHWRRTGLLLVFALSACVQLSATVIPPYVSFHYAANRLNVQMAENRYETDGKTDNLLLLQTTLPYFPEYCPPYHQTAALITFVQSGDASRFAPLWIREKNWTWLIIALGGMLIGAVGLVRAIRSAGNVEGQVFPVSFASPEAASLPEISAEPKPIPAFRPLPIKPMPRRILWSAFFVLVAGLALFRLDNTFLWEDESHDALIGRNLLKTGKLTGWDGRNLYAYANGGILRDDLVYRNPPLAPILAAGAFSLFGESTWSARLSFVLFGLGALILFVLLLRQDFQGHGVTIVFAACAFALSPVYLMNIRQCRYYSLCLFFSLAIYYFYKRYLDSRQIRWPVGIALSAICLFYANWMLCASFLLTMALAHFSVHRQEFGKRDWRVMIGAFGFFFVATAPYALTMAIWHRPDFADFPRAPWLIEKATLIWWGVREMSFIGAMPWALMVVLLHFLLREGRGSILRDKTIEWSLMAFGNILFISLLSSQPVLATEIADIRYLICAIPFAFGLIGIALCFVHSRNRRFAYFLFSLVLLTNFLGIHSRWEFKSYLFEYVKEITHEYRTSVSDAVEFLTKNAQQDDSVYVFPETDVYPLMFYAGKKILFSGVLNEHTQLNRAPINGIRASLFKEDSFPDWILLFGESLAGRKMIEYFSRPHEVEGAAVAFEYEQVSALDVYCQDLSRPELPIHSFGPVTDFSPETMGIKIFRKRAD